MTGVILKYKRLLVDYEEEAVDVESAVQSAAAQEENGEIYASAVVDAETGRVLLEGDALRDAIQRQRGY